MSNFDERLRELLRENGLSTHRFALLTGIPCSVVSNWTKKPCDITLDKLLILADFFDCSLDYLTGRSDDISKCGFIKSPDFAANLKKIVDASGKSIYCACKNTTLAWTCFYDWFHGKSPRLSSLIQLADFYGLSLDSLVGRE